MKDDGERRFAVATGTPEFLQHVFRRGRLLPVNDKPDVRHVEAHAEGVGADDVVRHRKALSKEAFDQLLPLPRRAEA